MTTYLSNKEKEFCLKLLSLFKIEGKPANEMITEGQLEIFGVIVLKKSLRIHVMTSTQYGKSLIVALACLVLACIDGDLVSIPAPTEDKAKIIMRYFLQHLGDHPLFYSQLEKEDKVDKLIMETSRSRLVLKNRGGIFVLSVHAGDSLKGFEAAMGEGSNVVISDESALIPDAIEASIFRMLAGKKNGVYVKIGNPFYRNHFYRSSKDERYLKIIIDFKQGLKEGRYNYDFIEEARTKPNFDILFGCQFPDEEAITADGYYPLIKASELTNCFVTKQEHAGYKILGIDPAAGGDRSAVVLKSSNYQEVLFNHQLNDIMDFVSNIATMWREQKVDYGVVDRTGVGEGVYARLKEMGFNVRGVSFAEKPDSSDYQNLKAELYWKQRQWLLSGGRLFKNVAWEEFDLIKYKNKDGKLMIQPKEELFRQGKQSPNVVDAAVLTMAISDVAIRSSKSIRARGLVFHDRMSDVWHNR